MPPRVKGFFVTLEGGDGTGKSTQARALARWLRSQGSVVHLTREPGGTVLGERVRQALLAKQPLDAWTEMLLFQALRAQHAAEVIRPQLSRGRVVVCDRYADSTMAYQGYGLGLDRRLIDAIARVVTRGAVPDLTMILDAAPADWLRRARRRTRMERRGLAFQRRVRAGFLAIARRNPARCRVIRVQPDPAVTQQLIRRAVRDALQRRRRP